MCAHASSMEKAKLQMKRVRKASKDRKRNYALISIEDKKRMEENRLKKTLAEHIDVAIYDYDHQQYPTNKFSYLEKLLIDRIKEAKIEILELDNFLKAILEVKIKKMEDVLNVIRKR